MELAVSSEAASAAPLNLFKKRTSKNSNIRKRPATPPEASDSSSDFSDSDSELRVKRRRKTAVVVSSSDKNIKPSITSLEATKFTADRSGQIVSVNDATKQSNWYDEQSAENSSTKALSARSHLRPGPGTILTPDENDGTYKGASQYQSFIQKSANAPSRQVGPIKAPTNIRTITVTDYAPDVCKDYKQTGFCAFGDSCKFLHAREAYRQGWELDKDWEIATKGKKLQGTKVSGRGNELAESDDDNDAKLEDIPFACVICKKPYTNPIITKCGHYFCESCALQRYRKSPACAACGAGTGGVFNGAKGLKKLLEKKRERAERRREKALANGEEVDDDEDEGGGEGEEED